MRSLTMRPLYASVSSPSRPLPTSMRTLRSSFAINKSTPFLRLALPMPQLLAVLSEASSR